jgi:hypothetical protein
VLFRRSIVRHHNRKSSIKNSPKELPPVNEQLKSRLFGLFMLVFGIGLTTWNWYSLENSGRYYLGASFFAPLIAVMAIHFMIFAPPIGDKSLNPIKIVFLTLGFIAGGVNAYLMAN